jgi:hypothetical protein
MKAKTIKEINEKESQTISNKREINQNDESQRDQNQ